MGLKPNATSSQIILSPKSTDIDLHTQIIHQRYSLSTQYFKTEFWGVVTVYYFSSFVRAFLGGGIHCPVNCIVTLAKRLIPPAWVYSGFKVMGKGLLLPKQKQLIFTPRCKRGPWWLSHNSAQAWLKQAGTESFRSKASRGRERNSATGREGKRQRRQKGKWVRGRCVWKPTLPAVESLFLISWSGKSGENLGDQ